MEELDNTHETDTTSQGRCHSEFVRVDETASGPLDLGAPVPGETEIGIKGDNKTIMNGHARTRTKIGSVGRGQDLRPLHQPEVL